MSRPSLTTGRNSNAWNILQLPVAHASLEGLEDLLPLWQVGESDNWLVHRVVGTVMLSL